MATSIIRKTITARIFNKLGIPTTATSYDCEWQNYDLLIINAVQYGNALATVVVPKSYMDTTSSSNRVRIHEHLQGYTFQVYKNGDDKIYAVASNSDANFGLMIYGLRF